MGNQSVAGEATYVLPTISKEFILSIDGGDALTQTLLVQGDGANISLVLVIICLKCCIICHSEFDDA